jgi:hypothetical protein
MTNMYRILLHVQYWGHAQYCENRRNLRAMGWEVDRDVVDDRTKSHLLALVVRSVDSTLDCRPGLDIVVRHNATMVDLLKVAVVRHTIGLKHTVELQGWHDAQGFDAEVAGTKYVNRIRKVEADLEVAATPYSFAGISLKYTAP